MEIEVVRLPVGGLQGGDALAPGVAIALARSEIVQRRQAQEVERADVGQAGAVLPVGRQLGVEGRRDRKVFLDRDETRIGQFGPGRRHVLREPLLVVGVHGHSEVVLAQHEVARGHLVHGLVQFDDLAHRLVAGRDHHAFGAVQHLERVLPAHGAEGVGNDVFEIQVLQTVEDAGIGGVAELLDVEDGAIVVSACWRGHHEVAGPVGEQVAAGGQVAMDRGIEHRLRLVGAIDQRGVQLQRFGEDHAVFRLVHAKTAGCIVLEHGLYVAGQFQHLFHRAVLLGTQAYHVRALFHEALPGHHGPVDHREVQLVAHDALPREPTEVGIGHLLVECLGKA